MTEAATPLRERTLAALAARQHGVVSLRQLEALGLGASAVRMRVARGSLHALHRGVYAVGHPRLSAIGRSMAAVLACGAGATLSHRSAAALLGIRPSSGGRVDVSSPRRAGRGRPGITVHSGLNLARHDVTLVEGIPCTTVARTLLDLAEVVGPEALERACARAETLGLFDERSLNEVLARATGRRGASVLADTLARWRPESAVARSELERRFLRLCTVGQIPVPELNVWLALPSGGVEVDFLWRAAGVVAETDGRAFHATRSAFERDRRRDQRLLVAGLRVARFTWRQVLEAPAEVVATLRALMAVG